MKRDRFYYYVPVFSAIFALGAFWGCRPEGSTPVAEGSGAEATESADHAAVHLTAATFQEKIIDTPGVALVDFWAAWCGPCRMVAPTVEKVAQKFEGRALVAKVDVDREGELAQKYEIRSIPALLVFKDGEVVDQIVGVVPQSQIESALEKHL